jgi:membrane-associated protease RseP (regulator of RpoE activity)
MTRETKRIIFQIALFIVTFVTTTLAGAEWAYGKSIFLPDYAWADFLSGMSFSIPLLLILTVHEFGHYFAAIFHRIKTSLPYYIPIPPIPYLLIFSLGTFGAVIRMRSKPRTNVQIFDVGLAGPLAGFVVAIILLVYGFSTLPPLEYIYQFHPEYKQFGADYINHVYTAEYMKAHGPVGDIIIGKNLIFLIAEKFVSDPSRIPNSHELMHFPLLLGVYFALFITSLNLLPIGQFDGGHVTYGLFGFKKHKIIATVFFVGIVFYAGLGNPYLSSTLPPFQLLFNTALYVLFLYFAFSSFRQSPQLTWMYALVMATAHLLLSMTAPQIKGFTGWLLLALILVKLIGIEHPPSEIEQPLDGRRIMLGWIALIVFILCFSLSPLQIEFIG